MVCNVCRVSGVDALMNSLVVMSVVVGSRAARFLICTSQAEGLSVSANCLARFGAIASRTYYVYLGWWMVA